MRAKAAYGPVAPAMLSDLYPERQRGKIDWIFSRGLSASHPAVVEAIDANGVQISDHDCLLVSIAP